MTVFRVRTPAGNVRRSWLEIKLNDNAFSRLYKCAEYKTHFSSGTSRRWVQKAILPSEREREVCVRPIPVLQKHTKTRLDIEYFNHLNLNLNITKHVGSYDNILDFYWGGTGVESPRRYRLSWSGERFLLVPSGILRGSTSDQSIITSFYILKNDLLWPKYLTLCPLNFWSLSSSSNKLQTIKAPVTLFTGHASSTFWLFLRNRQWYQLQDFPHQKTNKLFTDAFF
jgi:hypothetical protein